MSVADGVQTLGLQEAAACRSGCRDTIIPSDRTAPGRRKQECSISSTGNLPAEYGKSGKHVRPGPFVTPGIKGPITVDGITYHGGTMAGAISAGYGYQYAFNFRTFWRFGCLVSRATQAAPTAEASRRSVGNVRLRSSPTSRRTNPRHPPSTTSSADFFLELFFMTWMRLPDGPHVRRKQGHGRMGILTGFNGVNQGNFYGEGIRRGSSWSHRPPPS